MERDEQKVMKDIKVILGVFETGQDKHYVLHGAPNIQQCMGRRLWVLNFMSIVRYVHVATTDVLS